MSKGFGKSVSADQADKRASKEQAALDAEAAVQQWLNIFGELEDPRGRKGVEHPFLSIVLIAILATIGGAAGWEDIETYGESHQMWLSSFLELPKGVPCADTYRRLFERIKPEALEQCFLAWVKQITQLTGAQVVPIDGKSARGSYERSTKQSALHLVSAWSSEHRLVLGQVKVENKSNEITAITAVVELQRHRCEFDGR